jgi:hypothetical protein
MTDSMRIDRTVARAAISAAMSDQVGLHRPWSIARLSEATGISTDLLKAYRSGTALPGATNLLLLVSALGPRFANGCLSVAGLGGAHRIAEPSCVFQAHRAASNMVNEIAAALSDDLTPGRIDHREEPAIRAAAATAAPILVAYAGGK